MSAESEGEVGGRNFRFAAQGCRALARAAVRTPFLAAVFGGVVWIGAAPATAGGDFEDAFEQELGRLTAQEVVRGVRHLVTSNRRVRHDARERFGAGLEDEVVRDRRRRSRPPRHHRPTHPRCDERRGHRYHGSRMRHRPSHYAFELPHFHERPARRYWRR